jgi:hypothetical protein
MGPLESAGRGGKRDDLRISTFIPPFFRCPISLEIMKDPVSLCTGVTYDRCSIEKWLDDGNERCPATMERLQNQDLVPNHTLRRLIQEWCVAKGFDRIPTPTSPADPSKIRCIMEDINDDNKALDALRKLKSLAKVSERNRKNMQSVGVLPVLAELCLNQQSIETLRQVAGVLVCFSLDDAIKQRLRGPQVMKSMELLLGHGEHMETRLNAAILVESLTRDRASAREIGLRGPIIESLISLVEGESDDGVEDYENYASEARIASLNALYNLCAVSRNRVKIAEAADAVPALADLLSSGVDKKVREKCLGILDALSTTAEGRVAIDDHTLALRAIVKSLLVVSNNANEYAVGIIWRICLKSGEGDVLNEALVVGAFKKLLVLVQIDSSSPATKVKANQLLKLFSALRQSQSS